MPNLLVLAIGFFILPLIVGGGMLFNGMQSDRRLAARFAALHRPAGGVGLTHATSAQNARSVAIRIVSRVGEAVLGLGLLSARTKADVEATLRGAGHSGTSALRLFVGAKIMLMLTLPAGIWLLATGMDVSFPIEALAIAAAVVGGMLAPDSVVRKLRNGTMKRIQDELPDALDMMVICAQAGLGLGTTIVRVAQELRVTHKAVAVELAQTANELQMMTDAKLPLIGFGERCGVDSAKRLASTLVQSAQYGTPLTESLRGLAAELRTEMIMRFEARAARMPVLMTLPMVAFILPSLFLVIGGPAVIQVIHGFSS
jgi:tight adherence protein C